MGVSRPSLALAAGLALGAASPLAAQRPLSVSGAVVRVQGGDSAPVPGVMVTLHRISRTVQGPIDSAATGRDGAFRFRATADTTAVYLASARFAGIEYFSEPMRAPGAGGIRLVVSDTSSTAPVRLSSRHVIVRPPDDAGTRAILDLLTIRNDGPDTRVGRDSLSAAWVIALPPGALQPEVSEGDVSPTAVRFERDSALVLAPIAPGQKNIMLSYRLPVAVDRPAWAAPTDSFDLLVEEPGASVQGAGLAAAAPVELMGSTLRRWTAAPPAGGAGEVTFPMSFASGKALYGLVGMVVLLLAAGIALVVRRARGPRAAAAAPPPVDLIDALARLDARYAGRQGEVAEAEWTAYQSERARLKSAALARGRPHP